MKTAKKTVVKLTAEARALIRLSAQGRYLANSATNQRLADQRGCYGGFYEALRGLLREYFSAEATERLVDADLDIGAYENFDLIIRDYCEDFLDIRVILL